MFRKILFSCIGLLWCALDFGAAQAMQYTWDKPVGHIATRGYTSAPQGFLDFCTRHPDDCQPDGAVPTRSVDLTLERMRQLNDVNMAVNNTTFFNSDLAGRDVWDYPQDNIGDCEDFVVEKRHRLMEMGWPEDALLITIVRLRQPDFADRTIHAVLTARTAQGDYILDNDIQPAVPWTVANQLFDYVMIQSQTDPKLWALVDSNIRLP